MKSVDRVMLSIDQDSSVCQSIQKITTLIRQEYGPDTQIIFGKGGDRFAANIPEYDLCMQL